MSSSYLVHVIKGFSLSGIPFVKPETLADVDEDGFGDDFVEHAVVAGEDEGSTGLLEEEDVVFTGLKAAAVAVVVVFVTVVLILSTCELMCDEVIDDDTLDEEDGDGNPFF